MAETDLRLSVAVLDDDPDFLEFIAGILGSLGHEARTASTPGAFYAACEASLPDLVLLDVHMGDVDGTAVLDEIRQRWPKLCVVIVTGYPSMDSMRGTFKRDAFDYLSKPFAEADLQRVLEQAAEAFGLGQKPQARLRASLGRQIRVARTDRGWTLKELSEASEVSVSQLSAIERGTHLPSVESLLAIGGALSIPPSRWLTEAGF